MEQVDITKLSVVELKAMAYDEIERIEKAKHNLKLIQSEMAKHG